LHRPPPSLTLFPYTTLFRSVDCSSVNPSFSKRMAALAAARQIRFVDAPVTGSAPVAAEGKLVFWVGAESDDLETIRPLLLCMGRSEEHTSELQSLAYLVCRL